MLESTVESLRVLPGEMRQLSGRVDRLESQFVQLRAEMRDGFSALRREMVTTTDLKAALAEQPGEFRAEMATKADLSAGFAALRAELATKVELSAGLDSLRGELRAEFRDGIAGAVLELSGAIAETRADFATRLDAAQGQTRLLFEDVIERLKVIGERA